MCLYITLKMDTIEVLKKWLAYIMVRGDADGTSFLYDFDEERSKILYSTYNHPLPNIFEGTEFKNTQKC